MRTTRPMLALNGAVVAMALALTGCGADGHGSGHGGGHGGGSVPARAATGSLEQLAATAKCRPDLQTDADEIRQAVCGTGEDRYVLATFATDRGRREWINTAKDYGGHYLVGRKWVAVGHADVVRSLRGRLGGTLEEGASHGGHDGHEDAGTGGPGSHP
ncbi:hypothetical protein ABZ354_04355 [Streptomyces sp. NPDC005925]|uniref:hypothetical protein n=1 Tax=Streptomyces sp. NPDC005925 TaxID=3157172 RepID=UPI0033D107C7